VTPTAIACSFDRRSVIVSRRDLNGGEIDGILQA